MRARSALGHPTNESDLRNSLHTDFGALTWNNLSFDCNYAFMFGFRNKNNFTVDVLVEFTCG